MEAVEEPLYAEMENGEVDELEGVFRPTQEIFAEVSQATGHFLETCFSEPVGPDDFFENIKKAFPRPNVDSLMVPTLDVDVREYCAARRFSINKPLEAGLFKAQSLLADAVGPLTALLEASVSGPDWDPQIIRKTVSATTHFLANASQRLTSERRRNVLQAMHLDGQPQVLNSLPVAGPDLFGETFRSTLKDKSRAFKDLDLVLQTTRRRGEQRRFVRRGSSRFRPYVPPSGSARFPSRGRPFRRAPSGRAGHSGRGGFRRFSTAGGFSDRSS